MTQRNTPPFAQAQAATSQASAELRREFFARVLRAMDSPEDLLQHLQKAFPICTGSAEMFAQLDDLKRCLDSFRPFNVDQQDNLQAAWDTEYTYESNRIEGNTLTLRETSLVINEGLTIGGKSMREHLEAINHRDAITLMRELAAGSAPINSRMQLQLHALILRTIDPQNAGIYRNVRVGVRGSNRVFPNPVKVPELIEDVFAEFEEDSKTMHPVMLAGKLHHRLVYVHPFVDGNGRTARLMQNLVLLRGGFVIANIKGADADRLAYYDAIQKADNGDYSDFYRIVCETERRALLEYLAMASGNIGEEDADKGAYFFERVNALL